ncbi:MAG: disulfide bond formation protein B, partial [Oleibacter sp.]|nr:disulfide bond formation protein B [Thalassolituus sp.]
YEYAQYLDPCPLCIVQRIVVLMIGLGCLLAFFLRHASWGLWLTVLWVVAWSLFGWWVTDHHLWIQNLPADQVPSCGPDLAYMVQTLPLGELISTMLRGNGSCAEVSWTFLSFSMPWWMRAVSIGFVIVSVVGLIRTWPKTASSAV